MKTMIRLFALSLVVVSAAAAATAPTSARISSHQSVSASVPVPACGPHLPGCNLAKN